MTFYPTSSRPTPGRREGLAYVFLAAVLIAGLAALTAVLIFATPRTPTITAGNIRDFPPHGAPYHIGERSIQAWLVNTGEEILIFAPYTPFDKLRCDYKWIPSTLRFEDPCSGSKFTLTGVWIEGPASRNLDTYPYHIDADGFVRKEIWETIRGAPRN